MQVKEAQDVPRIGRLDVAYVIGLALAVFFLVFGRFAWVAGRSEGQMIFIGGLVIFPLLVGYYYLAKWVGYPAIRR